MGNSGYDQTGHFDMTTDDVYHERGISLLHIYMAEYFVDEPEYMVKVPAGLKHVMVLLEPTSIIEKGIAQAYEIQRRLKVWAPKRVAVLGTGPIGLLAALSLRMKGLDVTGFGRRPATYKNADLLEEIGVRYISTSETPLKDAASAYGPFDLMLEATSSSTVVFEAMEYLEKNVVLILSSVTGGQRIIEAPGDIINLGFVLGNKVMVGTVTAHRDHFEAGVYDLVSWFGV